LIGLDVDLELARTAALAAGETVMRWFGTDMDVRFKEPGQPLTEADLAADRLLREMLTRDRQGYGWLSEETADTPDRLGRHRVWIVDPIDGTRSFIAGRPEFAISIGLAEDGEVVAGVVYNPATGELFSAVRAGGAFLEQVGSARVRLAGGSAAPVVRTVLASRSEIAAGEFAGAGDDWQVQPVGSTAYKLARVAAGRGDAFLSRGPKSEWDICAGVLLVCEAGGVVTDLLHRPPRFNGADPYVHGIVAAASGRVHDDMMQRMNMLAPPTRLRHWKEG
jgi:myo-inositol-1(or 4)-monophosphatase